MSSCKRNVEIKARVSDAEGVAAAAEALQGKSCCEAVLRQRDTFYESRFGRLKLRRERDEISNREKIQLVHYNRPDEPSAKLSEYRLFETEPDKAEELHLLLKDALGQLGDVSKTRRLFLVGQTRVHVDRVEGLGDFAELEVVLEPHQTAEQGQEIARELMEKLGIAPEDLLRGSYKDLLAK